MAQIKKPKRTTDQLAADFKEKSDKYRRRWYLAQNPSVDQALNCAKDCEEIAKLGSPDLGEVMKLCAQAIRKKCESIISAGLNGTVIDQRPATGSGSTSGPGAGADQTST